MAKSYSPLRKVTDATRWDAEDIFGRLCILAHAAFLYAGFHPIAAPAATPWSLSRSYSVLSAHHQNAAASVVLRLYRRWGRRGRTHMALRAYVMANGGGRYMARRQWLVPEGAVLETVLSGGLEDTARALRAPGSDGEQLWKLLSDGICRGLFQYTCGANGVPVPVCPVIPNFTSLPGDMKMAILEKLDDDKDVAMAECASKELRDLVASHDSVLWKAKYEAICPYDYCMYLILLADEDTPLIRWKERYVKARARHSKSCPFRPFKRREQSEMNPMLHIPSTTIRETMLLLGMIPKPRRRICKVVVQEPRKPTTDDTVSIVALRRAVVEENRRRRSAGRTSTMVSKRSYRKEHQTGAVHSPSLRNHWKHR
ncbi:unnamed protein product [Urochloa humidicola]